MSDDDVTPFELSDFRRRWRLESGTVLSPDFPFPLVPGFPPPLVLHRYNVATLSSRVLSVGDSGGAPPPPRSPTAPARVCVGPGRRRVVLRAGGGRGGARDEPPRVGQG